MSKVKEQAGTDPVATTLSNLVSQIQSPSLSKTDRRLLRDRNGRTPDELVEMLCHLADQGGGQILGMSFDATTARATLASTSAMRTEISLAKQLLTRMEDDLAQQRATVTDPSFAIYTALRRLVRTKAGNSLAPALAQMAALVNPPRKSRNKASTETATTTAPKAAVAAAPAAPTETAAPAAVVTTSH